MFTHINFQIETVLNLSVAGLHLQLFQLKHHQMTDTREISAQDYMYKISSITGASEY